MVTDFEFFVCIGCADVSRVGLVSKSLGGVVVFCEGWGGFSRS